MLSINALLQVIQTVAEAHSQINKFVAGQRYDFSASEALQYPCLWVVPNGGEFRCSRETHGLSNHIYHDGLG